MIRFGHEWDVSPEGEWKMSAPCQSVPQHCLCHRQGQILGLLVRVGEEHVSQTMEVHSIEGRKNCCA